MTIFAVCGPVRHASLVIERLRRQGVALDDIRPVLTASDAGNNARSAIALSWIRPAVTWTEDSRELLTSHTKDSASLTGKSPTPVHAVFNMFFQNTRAAQLVSKQTEILVRMRTDMVLYASCIRKLQANKSGLAWNPVAIDSRQLSDQFMALETRHHCMVWDIDGFCELFKKAGGIPESMILDRVKELFGQGDLPYTFERFVDFDIVYEDIRWTDSPRMFWIKWAFGWKTCYYASHQKGGITVAMERIHSLTVGRKSFPLKVANLLLKILYLPIFVAEAPSIARATREADQTPLFET